MQSQDKLLPLYSFSGQHLGTISLEKAMASALNHEASLRWKGQGRKSRVTAVYLSVRKLTFRPGTTITRGEMERNAFAKSGLGLSEGESMRPYERAEAKVEAWPETHDDRNVIISAGKVFGATQISSAQLASL